MAVYKQDNGSWQVRMRDPQDRQITKRGFAAKREAQAWEAEQKRAMRSGTYTAAEGGRVRLDAVYTSWLESKQISERTKHDYAELWRSCIAPTWESAQLKSITPTGITRWISELSAQHSPARVRKAATVLNQMLRWAVADQLIPSNPMDRAKELAGSTLLPRSRRESQPVYLSLEQVNALADEVDPHYRVMILTMVWTGLRFGEVTELRVKDVDLLKGRIHVRRAVSDVAGRLVVGPPKSGQPREVPILASARDSLASVIEASISPDDLIFTTLSGTQVRYSRFRKDIFDPAVKKSGLDGLTPHGLRHTYAALAVKAGANPKVLQVAMGHSDIRLTLDTYGGLFGDDLDSLAESMNAAVQGSGSETNVVKMLSAGGSVTADS